MRATKAYIAGAGTAGLMLGASIGVLALVSSFVAFGSWPGTTSHTRVDQVVLRAIQQSHAKHVAVRSDAVALARRHDRQIAALGGRGRGPARVAIPLSSAPALRSGQAVAQAPASTGGNSGGGSGGGGGTSLPGDVQHTVTQKAGQVTTQVQNQATTVQQEVDEVVGQVPPPPVVGDPLGH